MGFLNFFGGSKSQNKTYQILVDLKSELESKLHLLETYEKDSLNQTPQKVALHMHTEKLCKDASMILIKNDENSIPMGELKKIEIGKKDFKSELKRVINQLGFILQLVQQKPELLEGTKSKK